MARAASPTLAILDETDSGLDIDALKTVAEGVNAMRAPERAIGRRHPLPAAAQLHRARLRARAERRPARAVGRQGAGARARGKGYGWLEGVRGTSSVVEPRARAGSSGTSRSFELQSDRRPAGPAWLEARRRAAITRFAAARLPDDPRRGIPVHERRAHRGHRLRHPRRRHPASIVREFAEHLYGDAVAAELVVRRRALLGGAVVGRSPADRRRDGGPPRRTSSADAGGSASRLGALAGTERFGASRR